MYKYMNTCINMYNMYEYDMFIHLCIYIGLYIIHIYVNPYMNIGCSYTHLLQQEGRDGGHGAAFGFG